MCLSVTGKVYVLFYYIVSTVDFITRLLVLLLFTVCCCLEHSFSGHISRLSPIKTSKRNFNCFDMELRTSSGNTWRVVCFTKQRYYVFKRIKDSKTEVVTIKNPRIQTDDVLMVDFSNINTLPWTPAVSVKVTITGILNVLTEHVCMTAYM